ncbi:MAG: hypothetical protein IPJ27_15205 [Candidatus Accumulibacter sp.]|uniref:Uncharacterized protein n=1 Tax=Candidatus Accumulibacter proximus TaxID=2954385 RepID=A0A935Q1F5_9PROT|nr:hypothetical protein [Candidatus Accumulibacter proximus]
MKQTLANDAPDVLGLVLSGMTMFLATASVGLENSRASVEGPDVGTVTDGCVRLQHQGQALTDLGFVEVRKKRH